LLSVRPEAHHLYLKGRFAWNKRTKVGLMSAIDFFGRCLEMDPTFATAYAGLADSYIALGTFGTLAPHNSFPRGIAAALRALELNPELGEARVSLATAKAFYETDWTAAGDEFRDALRKNPNYATGHHWYGCYLFALGRMDQSISVLKIAQELDPLSPMISVQLASAYHFDRQYALACEMCRDVLELDSQFWVARWFLGMSLEQLGQRDEALKQLRLAGEGSEQNALAVAALAHCHANSGHAEQAKAILAKLRARARNEYVPGYALALILVSIGCVEVAFDELEAARRENSPMLTMFLGVDPRWDAIRAEKRFTGLMKSLHLRPDAWSPLRETAQRKNQ
jgi:tetratricopeptide (TPR) repeat protein